MKIIIECECGNHVEIEPQTSGNVAYFDQALIAHNFSMYTPTIDIELQHDEVTDTDDVDATLKEICIRCNECGEYICLYF